jgi:tetratricopeptide (TPR) repeat protein
MRLFTGWTPGGRKRLLAAALVVLAVGGYAGWSVAAAERRFRAATAAADRRELSEARRLFDDALRADPASGRLLFAAARAARRDGDPPAARVLLAHAAKAGWPAEAVDWEKRLLAAQEGGFVGLEPVLRQRLDETPDHPEADLVREVLVPGYLARFDMSRAYRVLLDWVRLRPADVRPRLWLFDVARKLLLPQLALEQARAAAELAPTNPAARGAAGDILIENHQPTEAKPHFDWLLSHNPDDPVARLGLARCLRELGRTEDAAAELDTLLAARPTDPRALAERGYCDLALDHPADAVGRLTKAAELAPFETDLLHNLSVALELTGKPAEAAAVRDRRARAEADLLELKEVTKKIAADPHNPDLRYQAGTLMLRNGQPVEGVRWLESALAENPNHAPTKQALADHRKAGR